MDSFHLILTQKDSLIIIYIKWKKEFKDLIWKRFPSTFWFKGRVYSVVICFEPLFIDSVEPRHPYLGRLQRHTKKTIRELTNKRERLDFKARSEGTRLRLGRRGAKVLVEKNIGSERRYSTEVRKERSEAARLIRRGVWFVNLLSKPT